MRAEGWWSALDHIFAWSLVHIHQCIQQSLKILKGFQQYANDLFLHQFPGCFSLLNMQHIIMFYINPPFKSYHVILRQPTILAAFCIEELMCKWGGSLSENTINGLQDLVDGSACTKYIFYQEKEGFVFPVTKGEVAVSQTTLCSAPGATSIHFRLTYIVLRAKLTPSQKDSFSSPVMSTSGQGWALSTPCPCLHFNVIRIAPLKGISQQSPTTLWCVSWRRLSERELAPFLLK